MRRLIFRPVAMMLTFLAGLSAVFIFTLIGDGLARLLDEPSDSIPVLSLGKTSDSSNPCTRPGLAEAEEYAVYSDLINLLSKTERSDLVVIRDRTLFDTYDAFLDGRLQILKQGVPPAEQETLDNFLYINERSQPLQPFFSLPVKHTFISTQEVEGYFSQGGVRWEAFYRKYPGAAGFVTLSRVGFNRELNHALVYMAFSCGDTCGHGAIVFLVKDGCNWRVKGMVGQWIS